jgi:hypothetical protein
VCARADIIIGCVAFSLLCWAAFELYVVFAIKPYNFTAVSAVFLCFNLLPLANLSFLLVEGAHSLSLSLLSMLM